MNKKKIIIISIVVLLVLIGLSLFLLLGNNKKKTSKPKNKKDNVEEVVKEENKKGVYSYLVKKRDNTYELVLSNNIDDIDKNNIEVYYVSNEYTEGHFDKEKNIYVIEGPKWYKDDSTIKVTSVLIKNKVFPTKTSYWFLKFKYLKTIKGLDNIVFDNVTSTAGMFSGCSSLTSLDLSSFDMKKVSDTSGMFASCSNLKTIYVNKEKWNLDNVKYSSNMFKDTNSLIGSKNTKYDSNYIDKEYARIDSKNNKGYLTEK